MLLQGLIITGTILGNLNQPDVSIVCANAFGICSSVQARLELAGSTPWLEVEWSGASSVAVFSSWNVLDQSVFDLLAPSGHERFAVRVSRPLVLRLSGAGQETACLVGSSAATASGLGCPWKEVEVTTTPEPATWALLGAGLLAILGVAQHTRTRRNPCS